MSTGYIVGLSTGHNSSVCLLKDGEIVFSIEEERLSRKKYDGGAILGLIKVKDYTDKVDQIAIVSTNPTIFDGKIDWTGEHVYLTLARKLGLIDNESQIIDLRSQHHRTHAAIAFYNSGFTNAAAVVADGAGSIVMVNDTPCYEVESVYSCSYKKGIRPVYKHVATNYFSQNIETETTDDISGNKYKIVVNSNAGITKCYEAVTEYCGFHPIEAGKTMGLSPYGVSNRSHLFSSGFADKNKIIPSYPATARLVDAEACSTGCSCSGSCNEDVTLKQDRRDTAAWIQKETQEEMLKLIKKAVQLTGTKNVVLSGGYGLNCVANYYYLDELNKDGIKLYIEPISNDGGTAIGAALFTYYMNNKDDVVPRIKASSLYLGPYVDYTGQFTSVCKKYEAELVPNIDNKDIVKLLRDKNIVAYFQGRSENGPRALGNRSILFDPTFKDGKDFVNRVKRREYFRPFAASVMEDKAYDWFDLKGMESSPHMMYAVNCKNDIADRIPSVIHVDGTCRVQTVNISENKNYYELISEFYSETGIPLLFNTSFNLGGEPLVETLDDAVRTLASSDIEYCYFPEYKYLVVIKNKG